MDGAGEEASVVEREEVAEGIVRLALGRPGRRIVVNAYAVLDDREAVLVDAGFAAEGSVAAVAAEVGDRRLRAVLLTHRHGDHDGGALALARRLGGGAVVRAHEAEAATSRSDAALTASGLLRPIVAGERVPAPGGGGARTLEAVAVPGHTRGHLAYLLHPEGQLFAGDFVLGEGTVMVGPPDGDMAEYMASLERVLALDAREPLTAILPGHGPVVREPRRKLEHYIRHRRLREAQVLAEVARAAGGGASVDALLSKVYAGVEPLLVPLARATLEGHLDKLEREGRVRRAAGGSYVPAQEPT